MATPTTPRLNADWHRQNRMPKNATTEQHIAWHLQHQRNCACRPIPPKLLAVMKARKLG
jgi:hypothetical protein